MMGREEGKREQEKSGGRRAWKNDIKKRGEKRQGNQIRGRRKGQR